MDTSSDSPRQLPASLYERLFLLAFDRARNRMPGSENWRLGCALRTAMFAELLQSGHLRDDDGRPVRVADVAASSARCPRTDGNCATSPLWIGWVAGSR